MPPFSYLRPDHEAGDVLQEHQRNLALAAQLDEVRALLRALAEQDAVVGDDAHRHALDAREAAHQGGAVARLELVELAAVDDAGDDLAHVEGLARVGGDHAVQFSCGSFSGSGAVSAGAEACASSGWPPRRAMRQRVQVVLARWSATPDRRVCTSPPPRSSALTTSPVAAFTSGGPPRKMVPWFLTMMDLVAHRRHVGAAGRARAHHHRDLRDALRAHVGLVEEDAAEVVAVGEDLVLVGQVGAAESTR
jgi:hypothetical protein